MDYTMAFERAQKLPVIDSFVVMEFIKLNRNNKRSKRIVVICALNIVLICKATNHNIQFVLKEIPKVDT